MSVNGEKRVILIGAGLRGKCYTEKMLEANCGFKVVAVAEPIESRREYIRKRHGIPENMCFDSWEPLLALEKLGDVAVIATMDRDHIAPAIAAMNKGYNLLLEKPAGATPEECRAIQRAAKENGVFALICHVLRYTRFFTTLKSIIDNGEIGDVVSIQHIEGVGNVHQTHSFVRGNWGNSDKSTPMILQKSCHDMDILAWLIGKKCKKVQSFGSLSYFKAENAPVGAPDYCIEGCPEKDCPYNAVKLYYDNKENSWFRCSSTKKVEPTDEDVEYAIRNTQYGKCVFKCDNNVVDHQVVNLLFDGGVTVSFTMNAFNKGGRVINIHGTKGELKAAMNSPIVNIYDFATKTEREINLDANLTDDTIVGGHGGGDFGIIFALNDLLEDRENSSVCDIAESCDNHMIAFAAEESRISGKVIDMDEFSSRFD